MEDKVYIGAKVSKERYAEMVQATARLTQERGEMVSLSDFIREAIEVALDAYAAADAVTASLQE